MPFRLLAVGDMHLGRRPSRLPEELTGQSRELGPAGAWARVVEEAIEAGVDAVALAGDVVEGETDFFEAYRELYQGVDRLTAAGIRVLGVVGNHDVAVLPRLAEQIKAFELLGRGGQWQAAQLEANGEAVTLWGWSFPRARVMESPLAGAQFDRGPSVNIGVLHCDREQAGSPYAPVSNRELDAAGLDGWLLGHIHQPDALNVRQPSGYLGSATGMDPGEHGARGPWLVTVDGGRIQAVEQWVLAPLRWERLGLDIEGMAEPEEARGLVLDRLRDLDTAVAAARQPADAVGLRVRFTGCTRLGEAVVALFSEQDREHLDDGQGGTRYFIERLENATRPEIPIDELAGRSDPAGLLARRLLLLERPVDDTERRALVTEAHGKLEARAREERWSGLHAQPPDDEATAEWLQRSGMRLLERLLAQREADA
jgi:DNA repair exonuclease SbcCD nuclease subunit